MKNLNSMKRTSSHILKYSNKEKIYYINKLFSDYEIALKECIELLLCNKLPLKTLLTSSLLNFSTIKPARWQQVVYKQASEIVRSTIDRNKKIRYIRYKKVYSYFKNKNRQLKFLSKKYSELNLKRKWLIKPNVENISINIDERFLDIQENKTTFDMFVGLKLPYFYENKKRMIQINLPIKQHKHSLKYKNWKRINTIQLKKKNNNYYINFFYEKELPKVKEEGISIGIDVGFKKIITTSKGEYLGKDLENLYYRIAHSLRGSNNYKALLKQRDNILRQTINTLNLSDVKTIYMEDLKDLKANTFKKENKKTSKKFRNVSQYALYTNVFKLLKLKCEEQGIELLKVSAPYTSQTCSRCKIIDKSNRHGEKYHCKSCGLEIDADYNAAINILHRGVYSPSDIHELEI